MDPLVYSVLHVASAILLVAFTFRACAAPTPDKRRGAMIMTGVLALVLIVAGFGLSAKLGYGFPGWMIVKLVLAIVLASLSGMAFRKPGMAGALLWLAALIAVAAVWLVYNKPF